MLGSRAWTSAVPRSGQSVQMPRTQMHKCFSNQVKCRQKCQVCWLRAKRGTGMVPGTQAAAFQTRSLPQTRRGPTAPAGWAPSLGTAVDHQVRGGHDPRHRPLREAEGYAVPRRSWGCQRRQTLDRAPPWAAGHPSRPRSWRCSPPPQGNHTKGVPFKREDVHVSKA